MIEHTVDLPTPDGRMETFIWFSAKQIMQRHAIPAARA